MHSVADILGHDAAPARRQTGKVETRSDLRAVFRLMEMACCLGRGSEVQNFWDRKQSQADALEELHITLYLENCGFAELQSPGLCGFILFFFKSETP